MGEGILILRTYCRAICFYDTLIMASIFSSSTISGRGDIQCLPKLFPEIAIPHRNLNISAMPAPNATL